MRNLLLSVVLLAFVGLTGFIYRNATEYPKGPAGCAADTKTCPDGTRLSRVGPACTFPACSPPNVSLAEVGISFVLPSDFSPVRPPDEASVAAYETPSVSLYEPGSVVIRRYSINASSTALSVIQATAIGGTTGLPVSATSFSSTMLGTHRFTVVIIDRFEGVVDVAYYLARPTDVLRFDAIDRGADWTNPMLDMDNLPTHKVLRQMLSTLQS